MSSSTTCSLYWVNSNTNVVTSKVSVDSAKCDSGFTTCTFPTSKTNGFASGESFSCTSNLMFPTTVSSTDRSGYICSCGKDQSTPPNPKLFSCTDACYSLKSSQKCSFITLALNSNPTFMDNGKGTVKDSQCSSLSCGSGNDSQVCTDSKRAVQYTCDNQLQSDVTQKAAGYVCNCEGPAQVPNGFGETGTKDECAGQSSGSGSDAGGSSASPSATDSSNNSASAAASSTPPGSSSTSASSSSPTASGAANKNAASATVNISLKNVLGLMGATLFIMGFMG